MSDRNDEGRPTAGTERERRVPTTDLYEAAKAREGELNHGPSVLDEETRIPERRGAARAEETPAPSPRPSTALGRPPQLVRARWAGGRAFEGGRDGGPTVRVDGKAPDGPSPVDALLLAIGTCAGYDVVDILEKQRTPVASLDIDVLGERVDETPRRLKRVVITFRVTGEGIRQEAAERAAQLSIDKYCSVRHSLREDVAVEWVVEVA